MEWGVHLPQLGRGATREALIGFAREIERAGVHSGWVSDHVAWPAEIRSRYPYSPDGVFAAEPQMPWLDPIGTLLFVAGCTEELRLGTTVLILGYRPAIQTAKQIATLDVVSGGRAILGVGVGWMREEFEALQMPFDHRGSRADEYLAAFRELFTEKNPAYSGRHVRFPTVGFEPKPLQKPLPLWVGGHTEPAFVRAVRYGEGFHAAFQPREEVRSAWRRISELCAEVGRDRSELTLSLRLYLDPDAAMDPDLSVAGSAQQMLDTVAALEELGVGHLLLDPVARGGVEGRLAAVQRFMADVAPSFTRPTPGSARSR
jgi:probable F420-dependent oxidoreductase